MSNVLLVPLHLDAIVLASDMMAVEPMADFTRLPYPTPSGDVNSEIANISEEIVSEPFQNENLLLKKGVHLHWALPDALTRGFHTEDGTRFPAVPNRWLVTRSAKDSSGRMQTQESWVVESDYLFPSGVGFEAGGVSVPNPSGGAGVGQPSFRLMGRKVPLGAWSKDSAGAEYLKSLTAVGYGEPSFAAFYPNCHSVFGLHDDEYADDFPEGLRYEVFGWYGDIADDYLSKFVADARNAARAKGEAPPSDAQLKKALESQSRWAYGLDGKEFPTQVLCYARLSFSRTGQTTLNAAKAADDTAIAVANTGTEALSAHLASVVAKARAAAQGQPASAAPLKAQIEDQLEAVQFSDRLEKQQLDLGARFAETRHEKGFTGVSSGSLWTVAADTDDTHASAEHGDVQSQVTLPGAIAHLLNTLNGHQQEYERARQEMESMRRQLFSDWYKYMLCAYPPEDARDDYPDIDEVRNFIETRDTAQLERRVAAAGTLALAEEGGRVVASAPNSSPASLAAVLKQDVDALQRAVTDYNNDPAVSGAGITYKLMQVPGPRYWQPNEPVVVLTGAAAAPSVRHGQDGRLSPDGTLACQLLENKDVRELMPRGYAEVAGALDGLSPAAGEEKIGFGTWTEQPWHPFLLEWEAEVFPTESQCNVHPERGRYDPDFVKGNFDLLENDVDLSVRAGKGAVTRAANVYSGSSILTPYASLRLKEDLEDYFKKQLLADYYEAMKVAPSEQSDTYFAEHTAAVLGWYKSANCGREPKGAMCNLIEAYELLSAPDFNSLSQALGGFNDALLMHKQTLQLPVADPLGFPEYQTFTDRVRDAVQTSVRSAPVPLNDFNPIRSGALKLLRLRLVDTFGQVKELDCRSVVTTERMTLPATDHLMSLPPRVTQPARMNFRWLAAEPAEQQTDEQEMNDHPATTPICGWLLANNLDNSLMIYDGAGKLLGAVNQLARWESAPGGDSLASPAGIKNTHLQRLVEYVIAEGPAFLDNFISVIDSALENIEPENYARHQDLALLMGRPVALVRASLNLELQGPPACHQGWEDFRQDLRRVNRQTHDFERVWFPVRLGEYRQFNDGLVGYWREEGGAYRASTFYAPQSARVSHPHIKTHADDPMTVYQAVRAAPEYLTMLLDPRGEVHATSGLVPAKAINLPPDQYADALKAIEITFLSAPILTGRGVIDLPLPSEPGYKWSWLQRDGGSWSEVSSAGVVSKQTFLTAFTDGQAVWARLKLKGWIKEIDAAKAGVTPKDARTDPDLGADMANKVEQIELILHRSHIGNVSREAVFSGRQEIREGWLKLSETKETTPPAAK